MATDMTPLSARAGSHELLVNIYLDDEWNASPQALRQAMRDLDKRYLVFWEEGPLMDDDGDLYYEAVPKERSVT